MARRKKPITDKHVIHHALRGKDAIKYIPPQLENESDLEYTWLQVYCMQGMHRSLNAVTALLKQQEIEDLPSKDVSSHHLYNRVKTASSRFDWVNRAQQYDVNRWAKNINELADIYAQIDLEWRDKCEDTRRVIGETIKTALEIQETNALMLEAIRHNTREYKDNMPAILKLNNALKDVSVTTINTLEIITKAWQIKEHTETIQMAEGWQQQALEALRKQ